MPTIAKHPPEELYETSQDYEALYELADAGKKVFCFLNLEEKGEFKRELTCTAGLAFHGGRLLMGGKDAYLDFCRTTELSFIKPIAK